MKKEQKGAKRGRRQRERREPYIGDHSLRRVYRWSLSRNPLPEDVIMCTAKEKRRKSTDV